MSDPSIPTSADDPNDPSIQAAPPLEVGVPPAIPTDAPAVGGRSSRSALFIVFLVVVIDLLGFGIVLPLLPRYGELYVGSWLGAPPPRRPRISTTGASAPSSAPCWRSFR